MHKKELVILLHGLCRTSRSMRPMESALRAAGFSVSNIDYPSRAWPIEMLSEKAVGLAIASAREHGAPAIHFVTHSLGGILVRDYLKRHPNVTINRVVMLGPPNQGSEVVDRLRSWLLFRKLNGPAGTQLDTDSKSAPITLGGVNFDLGIIAGSRSINWINTGWIVGRNDGKVSIERTKVEGMRDHVVVPFTHTFMMRRRMVFDLSVRFLKTGRFSGIDLKQTASSGSSLSSDQ